LTGAGGLLVGGVVGPVDDPVEDSVDPAAVLRSDGGVEATGAGVADPHAKDNVETRATPARPAKWRRARACSGVTDTDPNGRKRTAAARRSAVCELEGTGIPPHGVNYRL